MAEKAYIGVNGVAKEVEKIYVGVNGQAKKVVKGYIGVNGASKLFFEEAPTPPPVPQPIQITQGMYDIRYLEARQPNLKYTVYSSSPNYPKWFDDDDTTYTAMVKPSKSGVNYLGAIFIDFGEEKTLKRIKYKGPAFNNSSYNRPTEIYTINAFTVGTADRTYGDLGENLIASLYNNSGSASQPVKIINVEGVFETPITARYIMVVPRTCSGGLGETVQHYTGNIYTLNFYED